MKPGSLIQSIKGNRLGIVIEVFGDLDPDNPWVRVRWTTPTNTFEWCKCNGLLPAGNEKEDFKSSFSDAVCKSGSL